MTKRIATSASHALRALPAVEVGAVVRRSVRGRHVRVYAGTNSGFAVAVCPQLLKAGGEQ